MHELSIAMSIVEMAQQEAADRGSGRVSAVHLRLGLLSGVVKEALLSSYELACEATPLEGSMLVIEEVPIEVFCDSCDRPQPVDATKGFYFACPDCGAPTPTILRGKELEVMALELSD